MQPNTVVFVNRPGHWTHLLKGEVVGAAPSGSNRVKVLEYFNNAQSHNPGIELRSSNPQDPKAPFQAEVAVRDEYLIVDSASNQEQVKALFLAAED